MLKLEYIFDPDFLRNFRGLSGKELRDIDRLEGSLVFETENVRFKPDGLSPDSFLIWLTFLPYWEGEDGVRNGMEDDFWGVPYDWGYSDGEFRITSRESKKIVFSATVSPAELVLAFQGLARSVTEELIRHNPEVSKNETILKILKFI